MSYLTTSKSFLAAGALCLQLAVLGAPAQAGQEAQLAQCKAALASVYGEDARVKLRSISRGREGKMRLKVVPAAADSLVANCWIGADGTVRLEDRDGMAITAPGSQAAEAVSQR